MKDAARLAAYFVATVVFGALVAPPLYWATQSLLANGAFPSLRPFGFESYFHRALLIGAVVFVWPLLRSLGVRRLGDLGVERNPAARRDIGAGFVIAAVPLLCFAIGLLAVGIYSFRPASIAEIATRSSAAVIVPLIEEPLFRGLILGVLLRAFSAVRAAVMTAAFFAILHFLKAPDAETAVVTWSSGFTSVAKSFGQFHESMLVLAGFTTLFLLACILADARLRTRSLWLPIGLHGGWIFVSVTFNKVAHREVVALPWIGRSLLIGIAPLSVGLLSWALLHLWFRRVAVPA